MKKNRTRVLSFIICMVLTIASAIGSIGCTGRVTEKVDKTKTQLYIATYGGGYGTAFLQDLEDRFEKWTLDNEKSYEDGKVGVQVFKSASKTKYTANALKDTIASDKNEVYFVTGDSLADFRASDSILDITSYVASANPHDNNTKNIASKINAGMAAHHNVGTTTPEYYSLPFVEGGAGLSFDRGVFERNELFLAKGGCPSEYNRRTKQEIINANQEVPAGYAEPMEGDFELDSEWTFVSVVKKDVMTGEAIGTNELSAGPDGCYGTQDDGLPATLEEFDRLLLEMKTNGVKSLIWSGEYESEYTPFLARAFANNYHGYLESTIRSDAGGVNGRETTVVKMNEDGTVILNDKGNPELETITINKDNLYDVARQAGYYYGFKMFEMFLESETVSPLVDQSLSHVDTQYRFIMSLPDSQDDIAMLLDGVWWDNEADSAGTYKDMVRYFGKEYSRENRDFAYFPMPWVDDSQIGTKMTMAGGGGSFFVSKARTTDDSGNMDKGDLIKDFIQFAFSDESLQRMTINIGLPSPFIYKMDGVNPDYNGTENEGKTYYETMTSFSRSFYEYYSNSDIFYGFASTDLDDVTVGKIKLLTSAVNYTSAITSGNDRMGTFPYAHGNKDIRANAKTYLEGFYRKVCKDIK